MAIRATGQGGAGCHQNFVACLIYLFDCFIYTWLSKSSMIFPPPLPPATDQSLTVCQASGFSISLSLRERNGVNCQIKELPLIFCS